MRHIIKLNKETIMDLQILPKTDETGNSMLKKYEYKIMTKVLL
jgi:hypothetical protein